MSDEQPPAPESPHSLAPWEREQSVLPETQPFASFLREPPRPPMRSPNFADVGLAVVLLIFAWIGAGAITEIALHFHLFGISTEAQALNEIHYTLGAQAIWYLFALIGFQFVFPMLWHKSFWAGIEWNASAVLRMRWWLLGAVAFCFVLAMIDSVAMPGPANAPIDEVFRKQDAAWLMVIFGTTLAPFFEELAFRGFLLPAFCTACDWAAERYTGSVAALPDEQGKVTWSRPAMAVGSVLTSIPFALMHGAQTGYSLGPFLLLVGVSLALCCIRLLARSLAASTFVHACYNFLLFALMFAGTSGFKNLDKM